jgi:hypothetical protein
VGVVAGIPGWHARGQGFKSPQLHPRSAALSAVDRPRTARLGQQIGSNLLVRGQAGRPARPLTRPASSGSSTGRPGPHRGRHYQPGRARQRPDRPARSIMTGQVTSAISGFCTRACFCVIALGTWVNDEPLVTIGNRSVPMGWDPTWTKPGSGWVSWSCLVADVSGAPVLRDRGRVGRPSAARTRQAAPMWHSDGHEPEGRRPLGPRRCRWVEDTEQLGGPRVVPLPQGGAGTILIRR